MAFRERAIFELTAEDRASQVLRRVRREMGRIDDESRKSVRSMARMQKVTKGLSKTLVRMAGAIGAALAIKGIARYAVAAVKAAADFETGLVAVAKTTGATDAEIKELGKGITQLTRELPTSTGRLLEMAAAAGQLGVKGTHNILAFSETLARLERTTDILGEEGARDLARLLKITNANTGDIDRLGAALVDLGNSAAATEAEIVHMSTFVGQSIGTFGVTTAEVLGLSTSMKELGLRAQTSGSATGRAFRAIQMAAQEGSERTKILTQLMGQSAEDISQGFRDAPMETFVEFLDGLARSGENAASVLMDLKLGGDENLRVLPTLAANVSTVRDRLDQANLAWAENKALQEESGREMETFNSKVKLLQNRLAELKRSIGEPFLEPLGKAIDEALRLHGKYFTDLESGFDGVGEHVKSGFELLAVSIGAVIEDAFRNILRGAASLVDAIAALAVASFVVAANWAIDWAVSKLDWVVDRLNVIGRLMGGAFNIPPVPRPWPIGGDKSFKTLFDDKLLEFGTETEKLLNEIQGEKGFFTEKLEVLTAERLKEQRHQRWLRRLAKEATEKAAQNQNAAALNIDDVNDAAAGATEALSGLDGAISEVGEGGAKNLPGIRQEIESLEGAAEAIRRRFETLGESLGLELRAIFEATGEGGLSLTERDEYVRRVMEEYADAGRQVQSVWRDLLGVVRREFYHFMREGLRDWEGFISSVASEAAAQQADRLLFGEDGVFERLVSRSDPGTFDAGQVLIQAQKEDQRGQAEIDGGRLAEVTASTLASFQEIEEAGGAAADSTVERFGKANNSILDGLAAMAKDAVKIFGDLARSAISFFGNIFGGDESSPAAGSGATAGTPSFAGGGFTGYGSRLGGLDGSGGFAALLHPNEMVVDLSRGGGAGAVINITNHIQPGVSLEMIPQIMEATKVGTLAALRDQGRRGGGRARGLGF